MLISHGTFVVASVSPLAPIQENLIALAIE
jgi:hypothetical protein